MKKSIAKLFCLSVALLMIASLSIIPATAKLDLDALYPPDEESPLQDLSIGFYGDSICEARVEWETDYAPVCGWAGRIAYVNGFDYYNYGRSGASVSNCRGANTIMTQLINTKNAGIQHDIIVLHGGVNDAWDGIEVGTIEEGYLPTNEYDPSTFAPALEQVLSYIDDNFPEAEVCYIINFKFLNAKMGLKLMEMDPYVDATIEICEKWGIPYLDLYHDEELVDRLHPKKGNTYQGTYLHDFVHPSTRGYDLLYPYINEFLIELVDPWYNDFEEEEKPSDEKPKDPDPTPDKEPTTDLDPEPAVKNGCGASMSASALILLAAMIPGAAWVARKKQ